MTPEQQRIAIAEVCGWESCPRCKDPECAHNIQPDYLNDLNFMHDAETQILTVELQIKNNSRSRYECELHKVICRELQLSGDSLPIKFYYVRATAAQRAEAFLRTLNLWKE